jgi:dihydrodipicolinate synthase/N-acetylneuraminate lyase
MACLTAEERKEAFQLAKEVTELTTVLWLAEHPNTCGIGESSGFFASFVQEMPSDLAGEFAWTQGEDIPDATSLLSGAPALVTGLENVWIEPYVRIYEAAVAGNTEAVKEE